MPENTNDHRPVAFADRRQSRHTPQARAGGRECAPERRLLPAAGCAAPASAAGCATPASAARAGGRARGRMQRMLPGVPAGGGAGLVGLAALALAAGLAAPASAADKSWDAGNGSWYTPGNWAPSGVPGHDDHIFIGDLPGVQNSTVTLGAPGGGYDWLEVRSGMTLDLAGGELVSFDQAWVADAGSRIIVRPAAGPNLHDFQGVLFVGAGAFLDLRDNAPVRLFGASQSQGTLLGRGSILIASSEPFLNDGVIRPSNNGGMVITQGYPDSDLPIDLDGQAGGGQIDFTVPFSVLEIDAGGLTDSFGGTINMVPGSLLTMNIGSGWEANPFADIHVNGANNPNAASMIDGEPLTLGGNLSIGAAQGHLRVLADAILQSSADVNLSDTAWLELDGATTVAGAHFVLGQNAQLDFDGQTTLQSGEFTTHTSDAADGSVDFNGSTIWNGGGPVTINGVARQMGGAFVNGPMVINADVFDMDGDGDTQWTIWNHLTINADTTQPGAADDTFTGTLNIAATAGRLTVNVEPPHADFHMSGEMNLIGHPAVFHTRYAGDNLQLHGELNVSGKVAVETWVWAYEGALTIADADATLRLDDGCIIGLDCAISGDGEIRVGSGGTYNALFPQADFGGVGLLNDGLLGVPGGAAVDRFQQTAGGQWKVFLRGYDPGDNDQLRVTGGDAQLAGALEVDFFLFAPVVGDEFTILSATGDVTGAFDANPMNCEDGRVYHWSVLYEPHSVRLRLDAITGLLGDMNCDCRVNFFDIDLFVLALFDPEAFESQADGCPISNADVNGDGLVNFFDIDPFVAVLFP